MDWIQQWQSKLNKQNGVAPLVRTGGSRHTGLAALPYRNIHFGYDPLVCPDCQHRMEFLELYFNHQRVSLEEMYEKVMSKSRGKRSSA